MTNIGDSNEKKRKIKNDNDKIEEKNERKNKNEEKKKEERNDVKDLYHKSYVIILIYSNILELLFLIKYLILFI